MLRVTGTSCNWRINSAYCSALAKVTFAFEYTTPMLPTATLPFLQAVADEVSQVRRGLPRLLNSFQKQRRLLGWTCRIYEGSRLNGGATTGFCLAVQGGTVFWKGVLTSWPGLGARGGRTGVATGSGRLSSGGRRGRSSLTTSLSRGTTTSYAVLCRICPHVAVCLLGSSNRGASPTASGLAQYSFKQTSFWIDTCPERLILYV